MQDKSANTVSQEPVARMHGCLTRSDSGRLQQRAQKEGKWVNLLPSSATERPNEWTKEERSFVPFADSAKPKRTGRKTFQANEAPFLSPAAAACSEVGLEDP